MSTTNQHVRERQRLDFAKIQSAIQIPNLKQSTYCRAKLAFQKGW